MADPVDYDPQVAAFIEDIDRIVKRDATDERRVTQAVADRLQRLLDNGVILPATHTRPNPERYVMYPLHVAPDGSYSIAVAVWDVEQKTPIHDHGTWGVIGIVSGVEREIRFVPDQSARNGLHRVGDALLSANDVEVCCTTDQDVHAVGANSDVPCIGIHIYGADIGVLPRRSYDEETGDTRMFVSTWGDVNASAMNE